MTLILLFRAGDGIVPTTAIRRDTLRPDLERDSLEPDMTHNSTQADQTHATKIIGTIA